MFTMLMNQLCLAQTFSPSNAAGHTANAITLPRYLERSTGLPSMFGTEKSYKVFAAAAAHAVLLCRLVLCRGDGDGPCL